MSRVKYYDEQWKNPWDAIWMRIYHGNTETDVERERHLSWLCSHLGDNPRAETFLAGAGEDLSDGDGEVLGVRDGVRGEGVLFLEAGAVPDTVRRLVGLLGPGEEAGGG